jgi:hypothetical protein
MVDDPFKKPGLATSARSDDQPNGTFVAPQGVEDAVAQLDVLSGADCLILGSR